MTPPIESVYDDVTAAPTQAARRPDNQPPEPLPAAPEDWQATVAETDEHSRQSADAYRRYIGGIERKKIAQSAALRLRRDLSPADRAQAEQEAAGYVQAEADASHGLSAHREHLRRREELIVDEYAAFVARAEMIGERVRAAATELAEPLAAYLAAVAEAQEAWDACHKGTLAFIKERDARNGYDRGAEAVRSDAELWVESPLPEDAVALVLTTRIRPRVFVTE
jgi:hypothetical protein